MAIFTYDSVNNREDLQNKVWDLDKGATPFISSVKKIKAINKTIIQKTEANKKPKPRNKCNKK